MSDIRDKVEQALWETKSLSAFIDATTAIVLEEAARCVRRMPSPSSDWMADELLRALGPANKIPAAIRALAKGDTHE